MSTIQRTNVALRKHILVPNWRLSHVFINNYNLFKNRAGFIFIRKYTDNFYLNARKMG